MKKVSLFAAFISCLLVSMMQIPVSAEEQQNQSFTQPFQNQTASLSGHSVRATMYFTKEDYWDVKQAQLNLDFQLSQLDNDESSDLTVMLNGIKIYSWHPEANPKRQTKTIDLPKELIETTNTLVIEGQLIDSSNEKQGVRQTPANWLTVYEGSNVNFQYDIMDTENSLASFYSHFIGVDTATSDKNVLLISDKPSDPEISSATYAYLGIARLTSGSAPVSIDTWKNDSQTKKDFQLIFGRYEKIPEKYQKQISNEKLEDEAVIRLFNEEGRHILVVTSKSDARLQDAGRYIANQELMKQTQSNEKYVTEDTQTFTSSLEFDGNILLTSTNNQLLGANHQEQTYFINLPAHETNIDGSSFTLDLKYANNLDFDTSLVTVYANDVAIGSKKLTADKSNGDTMTFKVPDGIQAPGNLVIRVAFDLNLKNTNAVENEQTPWALVENTSSGIIRTTEKFDLLYTNYPNLLLQGERLADLGIVLPEKLDEHYLGALTNVLNLLGKYTLRNTGEVTYYSEVPSNKELAKRNLIILGTPKDNELIKTLNNDLYFNYNKAGSTFLSNEKLSIEEEYGRQIGTVQLLQSPYNKEAGMVVLTGVSSENVFLASTQVVNQAQVATYKGDAIVVDSDGKKYDYRFKKVADPKEEENLVQHVISNQQMLIYGIVFVLVFAILASTTYFMIKKYQDGEGE